MCRHESARTLLGPQWQGNGKKEAHLGHPLLVVILGLFDCSEDVNLVEERFLLAVVGLPGSSESGELATSGSTSTTLGVRLGSLGAKFVNLGKVGGRENLRGSRSASAEQAWSGVRVRRNNKP